MMEKKSHTQRPLLHESPLFWGFLFAAVIFRMFPYGVAYFPILDDNNMYGVFSHMRIGEVFRAFPDFIRTRPFAVMFDVLVISRLWSFAWLVHGLLAGIQCLTLWLLHRCGLLLGVPLGAFGLVFLALAPFGMEATWWMAASSRIVMGSFFTILSLWLLLPLIGLTGAGMAGTGQTGAGLAGTGYSGSVAPRGKGHTGSTVFRGLLFAMVHLLSLGFYEQYLVVSVFLSGIVILLHARTIRQRGWLMVPLFNAVLMTAYYLANAGAGNVAARGALVRSGYRKHISRTFDAAVELLFDTHAQMTTRTARAGIRLALDEQWAWLVLIPVLSVGIVWCVARTRRQEQDEPIRFREAPARPLFAPQIEDSVPMVLRKLGAGLLLMALPLLPFFLLENNDMAYRNFYPCLLGLALVLDEPARLLFRIRGWRWCGFAILGCMSLMFLFGGVSEVRDYKAVSESDSRIAQGFLEVMQQERGDRYPHVFLFNTKARYPDLAFPHFSNGTAVDWAFMGLLIARNPGMQMKKTTLIKDQGVVTEMPSLSTSLLVGIDETLDVVVLSAAPPQEDGTVVLLEKYGRKVFGQMEQTEKGLVFHRP